MGTLGEHLRDIREARGASLEDIARATRVGKGHLEALECESLHDLPAPVFVKGFIRAYCAFLQVKPEQALGRYGDLLGQADPGQPGSPRRAAPPPWNHGPVVLSLVLLVLLVGALLAVNLGLRETPGRPPASPAQLSGLRHDGGDEAQSRPPALVQAAPSVAPGASRPARAPGSQRLVVKAVEPTWIRVQMDRQGSVQELLPAGATREWSAEERFVLTVGNAGGLELELNGRALPPLGARGAVIRELVLPAGAAAPGS